MAEDRQSETFSRPNPASDDAAPPAEPADTGRANGNAPPDGSAAPSADKSDAGAETAPAGEGAAAGASEGGHAGGDSTAGEAVAGRTAEGDTTEGDTTGGDTAGGDTAEGEAVDKADAEDPLVAEWRQRAEENYQRLLRVQADFENYRRRTMREKEELTQYATMKLISQLLPVLDNFERALKAGAPSAEASGGEGKQAEQKPDAARLAADAFRKGVDMIYRQLLQVLEAEGLKAMDPVGQPFDPELHQAVMKVPSDEYEEGIVVEVLQTGYWLKDKVLRPAMVKVSGG